MRALRLARTLRGVRLIRVFRYFSVPRARYSFSKRLLLPSPNIEEHIMFESLGAILCSQGIERSDPVHFQHDGLPLVPWRQL